MNIKLINTNGQITELEIAEQDYNLTALHLAEKFSRNLALGYTITDKRGEIVERQGLQA